DRVGVDDPEDGPADQFLDVGGGHAFGGGDDVVEVVGELDIAAVELQETKTAGLVGAGDLDGEVDPARAVGQGAFEHGGAVGGQYEHDVGVACEAVHLFQQG